ncbi:MAG: BamA/TamA family outer membrane protein [Desulfobacterales bacterium]
MKKGLTLLLTIIVLSAAQTGFAQSIRVGPDGEFSPQTLKLPYAFYNENFGPAAGFVYGKVGSLQKQATILTTVIAGTKGGMGFLVGKDIQMPRIERLFFDPIVSVGYFSDSKSFVDGNPDFEDERAGSNDSDEDNYVEGDGWDNFFRLKFKYLLPMGNGRDDIITTIKMKDGIPISEPKGGTSLNPFKSGRTYLEMRPFYRSQELDGDDIDEETKTNGVDLSLFWDNRDFDANPSKGFGFRGKMSRDFGWFDSSDSWTNLEGELDLYFPLKMGSWLRQGVLALNHWTSYSPSWDKQSDGQVTNRPPAYTGSTLGGLWRMRGFPTQRFNDRAATYYAAELRLIPEWNPFNNWPRVQKYVGIKWLQFVPFVEIGRVAPEWSFSRLHSDMKWDAGLGIRAMAQGIVIRIDSAYSDEGVGVQMMISQPFQF